MVTEGMIGMKLALNGALIGFAGVLTYLGLDKEVFAALGWLLFIDYFTGVWKAKTLGHCITSNKMKYGVVSKFSLMLIPFVFALAAKAMDTNAGNVLFIGMNILVLSEVYSIIGNVYSIRTKEELPEWDAVAALGHKIRKILIKWGGEDFDDK